MIDTSVSSFGDYEGHQDTSTSGDTPIPLKVWSRLGGVRDVRTRP